MRPCWRTTPARLLTLLLDSAAFWMLLGTYEGEPIVFDPWQAMFLRDHSKLRAVEKAPQIGFSWLTALEALHEALMFEDATSSFVSVNLGDAYEKLHYARKAYYELPDIIQSMVPLAKDTSEEIHVGKGPRPSRLLSVPATAAIRGKRMSVYLDEVDFYRDGGREAFRAAMGRITRGGRITMGSTCFGVDTQLDRVMQGENRKFSRARLPWNVVRNPEVLETIQLARSELEPEDFDEEYGCIRGGASSDTFPASLIRDRMHQEALFTPEEYTARGEAAAGYDVGKSRHPSVLSVLEREGNIWRQVVLHVPKDERGQALSLPAQQRFLSELLHRNRGMRLALDVAGIGAHAGQALAEEFGSRVILLHPGSKPSNLPSQEKNELVVELKRALEAEEVELAPDRELALQFRRTRLVAGARVDQPGSRKRTHYDLFWATAYSWYAANAAGHVTSTYERKGLVVIRGGR